jgi:hypothetical protein
MISVRSGGRKATPRTHALTKGQGSIKGYEYSPQIHSLLGHIFTEALSDYRYTHVWLRGDIGVERPKATQSYPFRRQRTGVQYQRENVCGLARFLNYDETRL